MKTKISMPKQAEFIINKLNHFGHNAYIVGGAVRNSFLNLPVKDWDICTSATPEEVAKIFRNEKVIATGLQHGTLTVLLNDMPIEITTFRIDGKYSDGRRPDSVEFTDDLIEDLSRRDFTINAMAYNDEEGLIDPFGGYDDLQNKTIRCVGNPNERFQEDALRMLRALRFNVELGFPNSEKTMKAIHKNYRLLANVSAERIQGELNRILTTDNTFVVFSNYPDLFSFILPELKPCIGFNQNNPWHIYDVYNHTVEALLNCPSKDLITRLSVLFHDIGKPNSYTEDEKGIGHFPNHGKESFRLTNKIMRRLRYDNDTREKVIELVKYHDAEIEPTRKSVLRWLNRVSEEQFRRLLDIRESDIKAQNPEFAKERLEKLSKIKEILEQVLEEQHCFTLKDLAVDGQDLIELGFTPGKEFGIILGTLLNEVLDETLPNDKETLLDYVKDNFEMPLTQQLSK